MGFHEIIIQNIEEVNPVQSLKMHVTKFQTKGDEFQTISKRTF